MADIQLVTSKYCTPVSAPPMFEVATAAAVQFFAACWYNDLTYLSWQHVNCNAPGTLTLSFPKRKNDQFRAGSSVLLPDDPTIVLNVPAIQRQ